MTTKEVYFSYIIAFLKSFFLILASYSLAFLVNKYYPLSQSIINLIGVFGLGCDGIALFGLVGWEIQTWNGDTPSEKLNHLAGNSFISLGLLCGALAYLLIPG